MNRPSRQPLLRGLPARPRISCRAGTTKNQLVGYCYDAAGNLSLNTSCPLPLGTPYTPTYNYNAENQLTSTAGVTYTYDGDGKRVQKSNGKLYWYGMGSDPLTETDASGNPTAEYIFFNGKRTARVDLPSATIHYYFSDHLGSASVVTSNTGTIQDESDYYPFGSERVVINSDPNNYKFTGKERDSESGLDNFGARFDSSTLGRFMTPDPIVVTRRRLLDPQAFNLYAYVRNNPIRYVDPTGKDLWLRGCGGESATCHNNYVGSWDKDKKTFTNTTIQTDSYGNIVGHTVNFDSRGIHIDGKYEGVFASGTNPTVVNGANLFSGFQAVLTNNVKGTSSAQGIIYPLPGHSIQELLGHLKGPNEKLDPFGDHRGVQYRGGNIEGTDIHISFVRGEFLQDVHFDWRYPFGSWDGFFQHARDVEAYKSRQSMSGDPGSEQVRPAPEEKVEVIIY